MKSVQLFLILFAAFAVVACSGTQQAYLQNIQLALADDTGIVLSAKEVANSKVDLIYVKHGDRAQATMGLAYIEQGQYKWLSADNIIFVTQNGRLIQTKGLDRDLVGTSSVSGDPLVAKQKLDTSIKWHRQVDVGPDRFSLPINPISLNTKSSTFSIFDHSFAVDVVEEQVEIVEQDKVFNLTNTFWYEKQSGDLVRSSQRYSHLSDPITITYISRLVRLLPNTEIR